MTDPTPPQPRGDVAQDAASGGRPVDQEPGTAAGAATSPLRDPRLAWAVAVIAVGIATFAGFQWWTLAQAANAREEVREAAEVAAARITTFDGATIEDFVDRLRDMSTGDYAAQVTELFNAEFREALREHEVESVGEVSRSFVQELDGDEAEVFVLVRQTSVNAALDEPVEDELRMELTLVREDGRWLVSDVAVLGPDAAGPAPAPAADGDADDGQGDGG